MGIFTRMCNLGLFEGVSQDFSGSFWGVIKHLGEIRHNVFKNVTGFLLFSFNRLLFTQRGVIRKNFDLGL